jgi:rare lipoprotein A
MIEALIALYVLLKQHRYIKQTQTPNQGEVVVSERPITLPKKTIQMAKASWYDRSACGGRIYGQTCKTANGEIFNQEALTLAHKTLPFGTRIQFSYNGRNVVCRVNDRGPFITGREFDLSYECFSRLADVKRGVIKLEYQIK